MKVANRRTCSVCGNEFSGGLEFCPVCMLRMGVEGEIESEEPVGKSFEAHRPPRRPRSALNIMKSGERRRETDRVGSRCDGRHLQGVRRRSALPRDTESHQRTISR